MGVSDQGLMAAAWVKVEDLADESGVPHLGGYVRYLRARNLRPKTGMTYSSRLRTFAQFLVTKRGRSLVGSWTAADLEAFALARDLGTRAQESYRSALRSFVEYLRTRFGLWPAQSPLSGLGRLKRNPKRRKHVLLEGEVAKQLIHSPILPRDRLVMALLYVCGLRPAEAQLLRLRDVVDGDGRPRPTITVRSTHAKTGRDREVATHKMVRGLIADYLTDQFGSDTLDLDAFLFPGARPGLPIVLETLQRSHRKTCKALEEKGVLKRSLRPYDGRHDAINRMIHEGIPGLKPTEELEVIAAQSGHSRETLMRDYAFFDAASIDPEQKTSAFDALDPEEAEK